MDNLTHTCLGLVMAKSGLSEKFGRGTTLVLVVASNLPDIDVAASLWGGQGFLARRMITHSVFGVPILAAAAALLFRRIYPHFSWKALFGLCLLGLGVHVFFDLVNSYGVVLLYPLSRTRFEESLDAWQCRSRGFAKMVERISGSQSHERMFFIQYGQ